MLDFLVKIDHALFFFINNGWSNEIVDSFFVGLTVMGEWTIVLVAIFILAADGRKTLLRHLAIIFTFLAVGSVFNSKLKDWVDRPRPLLVFQNEIAQGTVHVNVLEWRGGRTVESFPSGHSMLAFFLMTYVGQFKRGYRPYVLALATGIAVSRVYVGSHFPLDCLAGAAIGAAWGLLAWVTHERLRRTVWRDP